MRLEANTGYLVRVREGVAPFSFTVTGLAVEADVRFRTDGLNLVGFPVGSENPPRFAQYLAASGISLFTAEFLQYIGGELAEGLNPRPLSPNVTRINRAQGYWIRAEDFSRFYGPLRVEVDRGDFLDFGDESQSERLVLTNLEDRELELTFSLEASDLAPAGQTPIDAPLPLQVRPSFEDAATSLVSPYSVTMSAGQVLVVELVLDRQSLGGSVGDLFASLLVIESEGERVNLGAAAVKASPAGLWLGDVQITQVGSVRKAFARDSSGNTLFDEDTGAPTLVEDFTTGASGELPQVSRPYPLRMIVHVDEDTDATMLSHIYLGLLSDGEGATFAGLTLDESLLDQAELDSATRLSVAHLPLDTAVSLGMNFAAGSTLLASVEVAHDSLDNPFVHTYHPDHDNFDARYAEELDAGQESFKVTREITLIFDATAPESAGPNWGSTFLTGTYREDVSGLFRVGAATNNFIRTQGRFALRRVSSIPEITEAP